MADETEFHDAAEAPLAPSARAELYRARAAELLREREATQLPRLQEKLGAAAERFLALAEASERLGARQAQSGGDPTPSDPSERQRRVDVAVGEMIGLLRS